MSNLPRAINPERMTVLEGIVENHDQFKGGTLLDTDSMFSASPTEIKSVEFDGTMLTVTGKDYTCSSHMAWAIALHMDNDGWFNDPGSGGVRIWLPGGGVMSGLPRAIYDGTASMRHVRPVAPCSHPAIR